MADLDAVSERYGDIWAVLEGSHTGDFDVDEMVRRLCDLARAALGAADGRTGADRSPLFDKKDLWVALTALPVGGALFADRPDALGKTAREALKLAATVLGTRMLAELWGATSDV